MEKEVRSSRTISRKEFMGLMAAGAGVAVLGSCGGGGGNQGGGENYSLTLIPGVIGDEFYVTMGCGAQDKAKEMGIQLNVQGPQEFAPSAQTQVLNSVVQSQPDAILIAPTDQTAMVGPIQNAANQDIAIFTVDTTIRKDIALAHIGSDNIEGGRIAGETLAKRINEQGKVLVISVKPGISTTDQRQQGFEEAIKSYPNIEYLGTQFSNNDASQAASITTSTLQAHPDLVGIFGANLFSGQGAGTGVRQAGKKQQVNVVAFDASPTQVKSLRDGLLDALIAQHPAEIGGTGVQMAVEYLKSGKKPTEKNVATGFTAVTRDNLNKPEVQKRLYQSDC